MADEVVISADRHFETLREAVWVRFCARHRASDRDRFDDLYAEWWAREAERAAKGAPSRAAAPAAFIAEAVHRVLIDDARARARGLARDAKGSLELVGLEEQLGAAAADDTASAAAYESLVHRVLSLVRDHLSERETRVFVWSYLYLQPSAVTARALGLSAPRVKKDRRRIAAKVGERVWAALAGELDLCAAYDERSLPAIFEILTVHVEDCPVCRAALGGVRRGALAVVGPELVVAEASTHAVSGVVDSLAARFHGFVHRGAEALTMVRPGGRAAAAVAVAASAIAGGAATHHHAPAREHARRPQPRTHAVARAAKPGATPARVVVRRPPARRAAATPAPRRQRSRPHPAARPRPAATRAPAREPITFEQQGVAAPLPPTARVASASAPPAGAPSTSDDKEFSIEQP